MVMWHTLIWHMLLGAKDDSGHRLIATIARSLDILQSMLTKNFAIIAIGGVHH